MSSPILREEQKAWVGPAARREKRVLINAQNVQSKRELTAKPLKKRVTTGKEDSAIAEGKGGGTLNEQGGVRELETALRARPSV